MALYKVRNGWAEPAPTHCTHCGETFGPNKTLVGSQWASDGFHRTHTCRNCWETTYTPPLENDTRITNFDNR